MRVIHTSNGAWCFVDDENYEEMVKGFWQYSPWGYACRSGWKDGKFTTLRMHREIIKAKPGEEVDHINRNKLDNRKCNLRIVTKKQNVWNRTAHRNNRTGIKGVGWHKRVGKFQARLRTSEGLIHIGYFDNPEDARKAYNEVVFRERGEFAVLS